MARGGQRSGHRLRNGPTGNGQTTIRSFRDLVAWQKAMALAQQTYAATDAFPKAAQYGLCQQLRRAVVSVPSNIAEGWGRGTKRDYLRFLHVARGSLYEVETQLLLAGQLEYLRTEAGDALLASVSECSRVLNGLIRNLAEGKTR